MADDEAKYGQAVRFLASLQSQKNQDAESQRSFLQSKGLSDEIIARAFEDVKRPDLTGDEVATRMQAGDEEDGEAFEKAARMFDEPLNTEAEQDLSNSSLPPPPPKTYPRSPLALYQHQEEERRRQSDMQLSGSGNPTTRYQVILAFLRSMCYFLVLGGGVAGVLVALYRTYILPRMVTTLDCRSLLLKHHLEQYGVLTNRVKSLRGNSLAPASQKIATAAIPRKGVLKKVQFADEVGSEKRGVEEEEKNEAGEKERDGEEKGGKGEGEGEEQSDQVNEREEGKEGEEKETVEAIDMLEPIQSSLVRLNQSLRADMSASAIGTDIAPPPTPERKQKGQGSTATTVEEESDADSWVSEEDSDELEFDPYSPTSTSTSKRKHDPSTASKASSAGTSTSSTTASALHSSLSTMNAYVNSQTFKASAHTYGGGRTFGQATSSGADKDSSKAGDVAQIRADIRSLKGLLLSRRNFPIYRSSPAATTTPPTETS